MFVKQLGTFDGPQLTDPNNEQLGALLVVGCQAGRDNIALAYAFPTEASKIAQFQRLHGETYDHLVAMFNTQGFLCDAKRELPWGKKNQVQTVMAIFTDAISKKQTNMRYHFSAWSKKIAAKIEEKGNKEYESPAEEVSAMGSLAANVIANDSECPAVAKLLSVKRLQLSVAHLQHAVFLVVVSALLTGERWSSVFPSWEDIPSKDPKKIKRTKPSREFLTSQHVHLVDEDDVITEGRRGPFGLFGW
jgi:hypothetical protein